MSLQCPHFISSCHSPFQAMIEPNRVNRKVIFSVTVGQGGKYCNSNDFGGRALESGVRCHEFEPLVCLSLEPKAHQAVECPC